MKKAEIITSKACARGVTASSCNSQNESSQGQKGLQYIIFNEGICTRYSFTGQRSGLLSNFKNKTTTCVLNVEEISSAVFISNLKLQCSELRMK